MTYYYACSYPLKKDSIIETGNWGRKLKLESIETGCKHLLLETVFENIRLKEHPNLPSRLNCNFLCSNIESAKQFLRGYDILYEVQIESPEAKQFKTDHTLINTGKANKIADLEGLAKNYWNPKVTPPQTEEILVESDVRIIQMVSY